MKITASGENSPAAASVDTLAAYAIIQQRLLQATSSYLMERYERSLDELLRNPKRVGSPSRLANNAYGNAGKVIRNRRRYLIDTEIDHADERADTDFKAAEFKIFTSQIMSQPRDQEVSLLLLSGFDASEIGEFVGLSAESAYVLVSRVRRKNRYALSEQERK